MPTAISSITKNPKFGSMIDVLAAKKLSVSQDAEDLLAALSSGVAKCGTNWSFTKTVWLVCG